MAIEFNCPHCQHQYRLKDELAGRTATCRNPSCRQKIIIPKPVTIPDDTPLPLPADVDAVALAALSDEPAKTEQPAQQVIPVECNFCSHKWTEPLSRAGKNMLCPNPECRQRVRIPEAKADAPLDWRQKRSNLPSLAKQHSEKLEGVQDAGESKMAGPESLKKAGAIEEEIEPRPLKQKIMFVLAGLGLLAGLTFGVRSCYLARVEKGKDRLMLEAHEEFAKSADTLPKDEGPLFTAALHIAGGEHALRHDEPQNLKEAMDHFAKARDALRRAPAGPVRNVLIGELASAMLLLGGTDEQVKEQIRLRWVLDSGQRTRSSERVFTLQEELRQTLALLQTLPSSEFELKNHLARRLARDLTRRRQATFARDQLPVALFTPAEQDEAKAIIALEIRRIDPTSDVPQQIAEELKARGGELTKGSPLPASAQTLFFALNVEKPPTVVGAPAGNPVPDGSRFAYTGKLLVDSNWEEALALARRPGAVESQLRAIVLCADWSDPGAALDAAFALVSANSKRKEISPYSVLRLSQIAAAAGKHEQAKQFALLIADEGLQTWAKGDAVRVRYATAPKERGEEAWAEVPEDAKKFRVGHAWGRLWLARQNARESGNRDSEVKTVTAWPSGISPFGKAGVALGLQDRDK